MTDRIIAESVAEATIHAPPDAIDLADWVCGTSTAGGHGVQVNESLRVRTALSHTAQGDHSAQGRLPPAAPGSAASASDRESCAAGRGCGTEHNGLSAPVWRPVQTPNQHVPWFHLRDT